MNRNARAVSGLLEAIVATKQSEVVRLRAEAPAVRARAAAAAAAPDFAGALRGGTCVAVIAEVKRRSPSAGVLQSDVAARSQAEAYASAGAAAVSVLTDREYFGGELADLEAVVGAVSVPVLRKDFTIDALQVYEARGAGAAAVLLIVRILGDDRLRELRVLAEELGMQALVEVHDEGELERALGAGARVVGVNNRDLATFETDLAHTERLAPLMPSDVLLVSESGVRTAADVGRLASAGAAAVLVGESLMRAADPAALLQSLARVRRHRVSHVDRG